MVAVLVFGSSSALGGASGTHDVACGYSQSGWNAPRGAVIFSRTEGGTIEPVISVLGEYRTHSMISHGPGEWVTHSTMYSPGTNGWPTYCSTPVKAGELREGFPGLSQVSQGGIYTFLYGNGSPVYVRYQIGSSGNNRTWAEQTADWLWWDSDYAWTGSKQNSGEGFYRIGLLDANNAWYDQPYVLYQYRNFENRNTTGWQPRWNGAVCSTALAWGYNKARNGQDDVAPYTYSHSTIVAAGNALYNAVESECEDGLGFWGGIGAAITCFESICDDAGRQVRNCMATGVCDSDSSSHWSNVANDPNATATSISPDDLGGWSGHAWSGERVGPWAPYGSSAIEWNSGGNVYGCFF